jgi:hypothetical protein
MNWSIVSSILSMLVLLAVAVAEILWNKRFLAAKRAEIEALNAQIEGLRSQITNLKDLTPDKLHEYYQHMKAMFDGYVDKLKADLELARAALKKESEAVNFLQSQGAERDAELEKAKRELAARQSDVERLATLVGMASGFAIGVSFEQNVVERYVAEGYSVRRPLRLSKLSPVDEIDLTASKDGTVIYCIIRQVKESPSRLAGRLEVIRRSVLETQVKEAPAPVFRLHITGWEGPVRDVGGWEVEYESATQAALEKILLRSLAE